MYRATATSRQLVGTTANILVAKRSMAKAASDLVTIELPASSYEGYNLEVPALSFETEKETLLKMYKDMIIIRRMEMAADALYKSKKLEVSVTCLLVKKPLLLVLKMPLHQLTLSLPLIDVTVLHS